MDFRTERWSSIQSNHSLGFPRLHCHSQKLSLLLDLLPYTWTIRIFLHFDGLRPLLSITSSILAFNKTYGLPNQAPQVLKETYSGHEVWLRHRYEGKVQNLPCSAMFTRWIMYLFQLRTFDLCSSANELQQNSNASFRKEYIPQILTVLILILLKSFRKEYIPQILTVWYWFFGFTFDLRGLLSFLWHS